MKHNKKPEEIARSRFDAVISRVGVNRHIGVSALVNQGVLSGDDEKAMESWTSVIESDIAYDEARACALNNRAEITPLW